MIHRAHVAKEACDGREENTAIDAFPGQRHSQVPCAKGLCSVCPSQQMRLAIINEAIVENLRHVKHATRRRRRAERSRHHGGSLAELLAVASLKDECSGMHSAEMLQQGF